jgi:hypothetical protein
LAKLSDLKENIVRMAAANWCTPLITCLCEGEDESSKVVIVEALGTLKLTDESKVSLAEQGALAPLVSMLGSGRLEVKLAALYAIQNLSSHRPMKGYIAKAGAMPIVLNHLFSLISPVHVRTASAAILQNMATDDGMRYFVNSDGVPVDEAMVAENCLAVQESLSTYPGIQAHVLRTVLGFVSSPGSQGIRDTLRRMQGISVLLSLITRQDRDVRDAVIEILYHLSDKGGREIAEYLLKHQKLRTVLKVLNRSNTAEDVQAAAAGILASFPPDDGFTTALVEADAIPALVFLLDEGTPKVKEAAVGAVLRFTDSSNIALQQYAANLNILPLLARLLYSGTKVCKERAAVALRNFSWSTPSLSVAPDCLSSCFFRTSRVPKCPVHCGRCGTKTTFCIIEAEAVPGLVSLVKEDRGTVAEAGLEALATLVSEDDFVQSGAKYLHDSNGVSPILDVLTLGTSEIKIKAV